MKLAGHRHPGQRPQVRRAPPDRGRARTARRTGFHTVYLMRRDDGDSRDTVQIHVLTFWESMAAITGFAGNTP